MSMPAAKILEATPQPETDQRVILHGVSWGTYCLLRELFDSPGVRLSYLEGTLEIMTVSLRHEFLKTIIARLVEAYCDERGVGLEGYGSATFKKEAKARGVEPDECYCVGRLIEETPDIALEVVLTSGGINKLAIYAGLGVREVWFYRDSGFELYALAGETYEPLERSQFIPDLDFAKLAEFARHESQAVAVRQYREYLRS